MSAAISLPPPSILIDAEAIVDACEMAEMTPPPPPPPSGEGGRHGLRFVEVTELAALLHLGDYVHARHLWRRHRPCDGGGGESDDPELRQLALLWAAARSILSDEPVSAYARLDECASSGLEPLVTYAREVRGSYRERCVRRIGRIYSRIRHGSCLAWFGYGESEGESMVEALTKRGWKEEAGENERFLIPPTRGGEMGEEGEEEMKEDGRAVEDFDDKIKSLAEIVSFMERKRLNA